MARKRSAVDSLATVNEPRWLVTRDMVGRPVEYRPLEPQTDLHAVMQAERMRRAAEGWTVETIPRNCSFCFASRAGDRTCFSVEVYEPGHARVSHGSYIGVKPAK